MSTDSAICESAKSDDCTNQNSLDVVMSAINSQEIHLSMPTSRRVITPVIGMLTEIAESVGALTERDQMSVGMALEEALTNAVVHGNLEVSSKLRDRDDNSFEQAIAQNLQTPLFSERRVDVTARFSQAEAAFVIGDEGPGFDVNRLPDPTDDENLSLTHGRGVFLMRSFMDEVVYNNAGNQVTLVKRKSTDTKKSV